jgi:DNA polymerase-1
MPTRRTWIVLDCNYLCHRAQHSTGHLSYGGTPTGVIYGFLKFVTGFQYKIRQDNFVFCFDSKKSKRKKIYSEYKAHRDKELLPEEEKEQKEFRQQIKNLRIKYLKMIGYKNIFVQPGYEADDIIASVCNNLPKDEDALIVTCDKDLYQLLCPQVRIFTPTDNGFVTFKTFKITYGIKPLEWIMVKAIAGCPTDNIKGVPGVGEIRALQILKHEINKESKAYKSYLESEQIIERNLKLVKLPFPGVRTFNLYKDKYSKDGYREVIKMLNMKSLMK